MTPNDRYAYYMSLRYPIELRVDPDGRGYVALHPDLPGCVSQGASADEAVASLNDARALWIRVRLEDNLPIPEPVDVDDYSGRFVLRVPKSIHAELARRAGSENVSLNHYVSAVLARHLGAAPLQTFVRQYTERLDDIVSVFRTANKPVAPATTAFSRSLSGMLGTVQGRGVFYGTDTNAFCVTEVQDAIRLLSGEHGTEDPWQAFIPKTRQALLGKP